MMLAAALLPYLPAFALNSQQLLCSMLGIDIAAASSCVET